jgi:hypothetical protein
VRNGAHVAPGSRGCVGDAGLRGLAHEVRQSTFEIEVADLERGWRSSGPLAGAATRWCDRVETVRPSVEVDLGGRGSASP